MGKSGPLLKLFEFLLQCARAGTAPKEIEIAVAVFAKPADFDLSQDASVRVYVHRLRKKLDGFYAGPGQAETARITIPKGEYRIVVGPVAEVLSTDEPAVITQAAGAPPRRRRWILAAVALLAVNGLAWWGVSKQARPDDFSAVRNGAPWTALLQNGRTTVLAIGDYYIFGEIDRARDIDRLVREYAINSAADLSAHVMRHPQLIDKYKDLDLSYLPISVPYAMREIMPIFSRTRVERDRVRVVMASKLSPGMLKQANIVYIGYLSGLGLLREHVFAASRFKVGANFDELVDEATQRRYVSQQGGPGQVAGTSVDYGYFSTFQGPEGNRIIILAGMRDVGLMQTAEAATSATSLAAMLRQAGDAPAFEALYEVDGIKRINIGGKLLLASPLKTAKLWSER